MIHAISVTKIILFYKMTLVYISLEKKDQNYVIITCLIYELSIFSWIKILDHKMTYERRKKKVKKSNLRQIQKTQISS